MLDRRALAAGIGFGVLALDQISKSWAVSALWLQPPVKVVDGWLHLGLHFNRGAAFGSGAGMPPLVLAIPAVLVLTILGWVLHRRQERATAAMVGIAAGGVLGNLLDRFVREVPGFGETTQRAVVDFIILAPGRWPAFNVADVAILVGLFGTAWASMRRRADEDTEI